MIHSAKLNRRVLTDKSTPPAVPIDSDPGILTGDRAVAKLSRASLDIG